MEIHSIRGISDENWSNLRMAAVRDGIATGELLNSILEEYDFGFTSKKVHKKTSKQRIARNGVESPHHRTKKLKESKQPSSTAKTRPISKQKPELTYHSVNEPDSWYSDMNHPRH